MSNNTQEYLGKKLNHTDALERDAVHIAVLKVKLGADYIYGGAKVAFKAGTTDEVVDYKEDYPLGQTCIGVVDPFLKGYDMKKGDEVYVFLNPGSVTGMVHVWNHPLVDADVPVMPPAEKWLRSFCEEHGYNFQELVEGCRTGKGYVTSYGSSTYPSDLGSEFYEMWEKLEEYCGQKFDHEHRDQVSWSCSC